MTKITIDDISKLILPGQEYDGQEVKDIVSQLELEKQDPDGGDIIIFHGKQYPVMRATYDVIRKTKKTIVAKRFIKDSFLEMLERTVAELIKDEKIKDDKEKLDKLYLTQAQIQIQKNKTGKLKRLSFWLYEHAPFAFNILDAIDIYFYKKSWLKLCKLTFGDNYKDFALGGLTTGTTGEVNRIMRIFFRFREELSPAAQDALKKNSPNT